MSCAGLGWLPEQELGIELDHGYVPVQTLACPGCNLHPQLQPRLLRLFRKRPLLLVPAAQLPVKLFFGLGQLLRPSVQELLEFTVPQPLFPFHPRTLPEQRLDMHQADEQQHRDNRANDAPRQLPLPPGAR